MFSVLGFIISVGSAYLILEKKLKIKSQGKKKTRKSIKQMLFRGLISGSVIAFAVFIARVSGPILGGVFASFPAMTVALIIITHISHGAEYTSALLKNFIIKLFLIILLYQMIKLTIYLKYS